MTRTVYYVGFVCFRLCIDHAYAIRTMLQVVRLLSKLGIACSFLSCLTAISLNVWIIADGTSVAKHATDPYGLNGEPLSNVMGMNHCQSGHKCLLQVLFMFFDVYIVSAIY